MDCAFTRDNMKRDIVRDTSIVVCVLSIIGSLLIIFSYIVFKSIRSNVRFLLVNLSLMDFGVGCANLVGILYDYESHLRNSSDQSSRILTDSAQRMCQAQAFLADWCTHSSIIWTILLPAYLYLLVTYQRSTHTKYVFLSFYFFGYGVPLISSLWLLLTHRLGYAPYNSAGWCTVQVTDISGRNPNIYLTAMSYDLWIYLSFVLVPVFCLAVHLRIRDKLKTPDETGLSQMTVKALYHVHYKFLAIPAIFILLRVWSCIVNIALVYGAFANLRCDWLFVLTLLSGIGDSGQGMTNAVLFLLFTKAIRSSFQRQMCCCKQSSDTIQGSSSVYHTSDAGEA